MYATVRLGANELYVVLLLFSSCIPFVPNVAGEEKFIVFKSQLLKLFERCAACG